MRYGCGETVCFGRVYGRERDLLIGRLRLAKGEISTCAESSILYLGSPMTAGRILPCMERLGQISAVVCCEEICEQIVRILQDKDLPVFVLCGGDKFLPEHDGRIALIDFARGAMIIDPKLDTLDEYSHQRERQLYRERSVRKSIIADVETLSGNEAYCRDRACGLLCSAADIEACGDFFELSLALAECRPSGALCIGIPVAENEDDELFCERVDAVFRSAVYGQISIVLEGCLLSDDVERSLRAMNRSYCRLEAEGKEINGYLARGVMIDSPLALLERRGMPRLDFLCFDFDAICASLLGKREELDARAEDALCRFWSDCKQSMEAHGKAEFKVKSRKLFKTRFFSDWVDFMDVGEIYLPYGCSLQKKT